MLVQKVSLVFWVHAWTFQDIVAEATCSSAPRDFLQCCEIMFTLCNQSQAFGWLMWEDEQLMRFTWGPWGYKRWPLFSFCIAHPAVDICLTSVYLFFFFALAMLNSYFTPPPPLHIAFPEPICSFSRSPCRVVDWYVGDQFVLWMLKWTAQL